MNFTCDDNLTVTFVSSAVDTSGNIIAMLLIIFVHYWLIGTSTRVFGDVGSSALVTYEWIITAVFSFSEPDPWAGVRVRVFLQTADEPIALKLLETQINALECV